MLSAGNEKDVFVWSTDSMVSDPLFTRMTGHKEPIQDMTQFPGQPFAATIDIRGIIKIWDIRTLELQQTIHPESNLKIEIHCSIMALSHESFVSYATRFRMFRIPASEQDKSISSHLSHAE